MKICFFAKVESRDVLEKVGFYADDLRALRELGHEVVIATHFNEIPWDSDLYYVWWWSWAFMPLLKAKLVRKPVMICGVFDYATPPRGLGVAYLDRPAWQQLLFRMALRFADANIFISEYERQEISSRFVVRNPHYVPCVVDTEKYHPLENPVRQHVLSVAWSGTVNAQRKCLPQIIEAFAKVAPKHPGVRLQMAGRKGDYQSQLEQLARELGVMDRVDFLGTVSEADKLRLMQTCLVYMQPTLFEGFGLATAEAMACGAAVISSPVGAVPEVVGNAGLMVNPDDVEAIAAALDQLLSDDVLRTNCQVKARARMLEHFQFERRKRELGEIIDRTAQRGVTDRAVGRV
jgi:glycosyltransferase involved in cell wall biosynthesis